MILLLTLLSLACTVSKQTADAPSGGTDSVGEPADSAPLEDSVPSGDSASEGEDSEGVAPPPSGLVINELMPKNESSVQQEDGSFPDWLELYNGGSEAVALSRLSLRDSSGVTWSGGEGELAVGEHLLLWADDASAEGHLPFQLSSEGEILELSLDGAALDTVSTSALAGDVAWARHPDGGEWAATIDFTPGAANPATASGITDPSEIFFGEQVHQIRITVDESLLEQLQDQRAQAKVEGSLEFDGITLSQVGVRLKGSGSYRDLSGKAAFLIDINELVDGQRLRGLKALTLNNANHDATWTHEYLTYLIFRSAGYPAPRVGFAEVYFNDTLFGLYVHLETYDDLFLERWFSEAEQGRLWEGTKDDFSLNHVPGYEYEEGPEPEDTGLLAELSAQMAMPPGEESSMEALGALIDLEAFRWLNALEAVTLQVDGYQHVHNFYLYHDAESDLFYWLTAGADYSWTDIYYGPYESEGNHFSYCLQSESWETDYNQTLRDAAALVEELAVLDRFDALSTTLDPWIDADPRKEHNELEIEEARASTRALLETWPAQMLEEVDLHEASAP